MPVRKQLFLLKKADLPTAEFCRKLKKNRQLLLLLMTLQLVNSNKHFLLMFCLAGKYFDYFRGGEAVTLIEMRDYN